MIPTPQPSPTPKNNSADNGSVDQQSVAGTAAYPVPENGPTPIPKGEADFGRAPDEVEGYFRNQYNFAPDSHRFFDPIFEPAEAPQTAQMGPKSTATYTETK